MVGCKGRRQSLPASGKQINRSPPTHNRRISDLSCGLPTQVTDQTALAKESKLTAMDLIVPLMAAVTDDGKGSASAIPVPSHLRLVPGPHRRRGRRLHQGRAIHRAELGREAVLLHREQYPWRDPPRQPRPHGEPDLFLHPSLEICFAGMPGRILQRFNAKALMATHSVMTVREGDRGAGQRRPHGFADERGVACLPPARSPRSQPRRLGVATGLLRRRRQPGEAFPPARVATLAKCEQIGAADPTMIAGARERDLAPIEKAYQILPRDAEQCRRLLARQFLVAGQDVHRRAAGDDPGRALDQVQHRPGKRGGATVLAAQFEPAPGMAVTQQGDQLPGIPLVGARHANAGMIVIATGGHGGTIVTKRYNCNLTDHRDRASLGPERRGELLAARTVDAGGRSDDQGCPRCGRPLRPASARHAAVGCRRGLLHAIVERRDSGRGHRQPDRGRPVVPGRRHVAAQRARYAFRRRTGRRPSTADPADANHPKDRHVVACAAAGEAEYIVTGNLRDFRHLPHGITAIHPDAFRCRLLDQMPEQLRAALDAQSARMRNPPLDVAAIIALLAPVVPRFAQAWQAGGRTA